MVLVMKTMTMGGCASTLHIRRSGVGRPKRQALMLVRLANQRTSSQKNLDIPLIRGISVRSPIDRFNIGSTIKFRLLLVYILELTTRYQYNNSTRAPLPSTHALMNLPQDICKRGSQNLCSCFLHLWCNSDQIQYLKTLPRIIFGCHQKRIGRWWAIMTRAQRLFLLPQNTCHEKLS